MTSRGWRMQLVPGSDGLGTTSEGRDRDDSQLDPSWVIWLSALSCRRLVRRGLR